MRKLLITVLLCLACSEEGCYDPTWQRVGIPKPPDAGIVDAWRL